MPTKTFSVSVREAVEMASWELTLVTTSIHSVVDRGDVRLNAMERTRLLKECLRRLESFFLPGPPSVVSETIVEFNQRLDKSRQGPSRKDRCDNAVQALRSALAAAREVDVPLFSPDSLEVSRFCTDLEGVVQVLEDVQFPVMFHKRERVL